MVRDTLLEMLPSLFHIPEITLSALIQINNGGLQLNWDPILDIEPLYDYSLLGVVQHMFKKKSYKEL